MTRRHVRRACLLSPSDRRTTAPLPSRIPFPGPLVSPGCVLLRLGSRGRATIRTEPPQAEAPHRPPACSLSRGDAGVSLARCSPGLGQPPLRGQPPACLPRASPGRRTGPGSGGGREAGRENRTGRREGPHAGLPLGGPPPMARTVTAWRRGDTWTCLVAVAHPLPSPRRRRVCRL